MMDLGNGIYLAQEPEENVIVSKEFFRWMIKICPRKSCTGCRFRKECKQLRIEARQDENTEKSDS